MVTKEEYDKARKVIKLYKRQRLLEQRKKNTVNIEPLPEEKWGVHKSHCCTYHGCKYGDKNCPVALGVIAQDYPCELCDEEEYFDD